MSVRVDKLQPHHLVELIERKAKSYAGPVLTERQVESLAVSAHSHAVFVNDRLMMCAGVQEYWRNRGEAWAVLDPLCRRDFLAIHNVVKRFFDICPITRIEAAVDVDFKPGHRWVKLLGFDLDAKVLKNYLPDGKDVSLYSRVRAA